MTNEAPEDIGTVSSVDGTRIKVEINKSGGCKSCGMRGLCGNTMTPIVLFFETDGSYKTGDRVKVSVSSRIRILSSLLIFAFPLIALFGFYLIFRNFAAESMAALAGFGGLVAAFLIVKLIDKRIGKHINFVLEGKCEDLPE
jgi:positive regulator of sigma E activity